MSAYPLLSVAAEFSATAAAYAPEDPFVIARELEQLPDVTDHIALGIRAYAQKISPSDYPINPIVGEKLLELYAAQAQLRAIAEEIGPLYRSLHAKDLQREEAPRANEHLWNV
jgi:hypothetical protein